MVRMASTATSITGGIRIMVTTDRYLCVGNSRSSTSMRTKPAMDKATSAIPDMTEGVSTALDFQEVATKVVVIDKKEFYELTEGPRHDAGLSA